MQSLEQRVHLESRAAEQRRRRWPEDGAPCRVLSSSLHGAPFLPRGCPSFKAPAPLAVASSIQGTFVSSLRAVLHARWAAAVRGESLGAQADGQFLVQDQATSLGMMR